MYKRMNSQDAPSAREATLYCTIGNRRYAMLNATEFEANAKVTNSAVPMIGSPVKGQKATGLEIKLKMVVYKCSEMFDELITTFKDTGVMPVFECQETSEDASTSMGRSSKVYHDCTIDGDVLLGMFNADGEFVKQTIEAYAMDYSSPEKYKTPSYM